MTAASGAEPVDGWVDAVRLATVRDGLRVETAELAARLATACDAGIAAACALATVDLDDRDALAHTFARSCEAGDAAACLGAAWMSLPLVDGAVDVAHPSDPARYRALVEQTCRAGLVRGCVELGWVRLLGVDTYPNPPAARELWSGLCDRGEAMACTAVGGIDGELVWLEEGANRGDPQAWLAIGDRTGAPEAYRLACDLGVSAGCVALAGQSADALPELRGACELGDPAACVLALRYDGLAGRLSSSEVADGLWSYCPDVHSACEEAMFLDQGADLVAGYTGRLWKQDHADRLVRYYEDRVRRCQIDVLQRDPEASGFVHASLRIAADGEVRGVWIDDPLDPLHATCLTEGLLGSEIIPPVDGETRAEVTIPVFHGAKVSLDAPTLDGAPDAARVAEDLPAWSEPLDRCLLRFETPETNIRMELTFVATHDGRIEEVEVTETSEAPEVDRCVVDWVTARVTSSSVRWPTRIRARISFLAPTPGPIGVSDPIVQRPWQIGEPTRVRVLVLALTDAIADRRRSTLGNRAIDSIHDGHEALARQVDRLTGGAVRVETTVRTLSASVHGLASLEDTPGLRRWELPIQDLPRDVIDAIEPGRWDSVFLWVPIPFDAERPRVGSTLRTTIRGATVSVMALPAKAELRGTTTTPAYELPLHEWWHQVEVRAEHLLDLRWLPSNHELLDTPERSFDPGTWTSPRSHTVMGWYQEVLGAQIHPELWRDLFGAGQRVGENLASRGRAVGEGVLAVEGLTDTLVAFGGFPNVPRTDPDAEAVWFGVEWDEPVRAGRVVLHLGTLVDPTRPSFQDGVLEVMTAADPNTWVIPAHRFAVDGATTTYTFAPVDLVAVRVRVVDGARAPTCREIEVHPQ